MNLQKMFDIVRKTSALINTHIGSNGDAHLIATEDQNGFMSKEDKYHVNRNGMYARGQDASVQKDILKLDYGFYAGKNWINQPSGVDDTVALIEVKGNASGFKEINYHWLAAGKIFTRYIYGATLDTGWENPNWIDVVPINGFTGNIKARRVKTGTTYLIEVRIDVTCNFTTHVATQIASLPLFYRNATGISPYTVVPAQIGNKNITVNCSINQGNQLNVFRNDDSNDAITKIFGTMFFTE